jgi:hypothetical protein
MFMLMNLYDFCLLPTQFYYNNRIHRLDSLTCPAYSISARTAKKPQFLCYSEIVAFVSGLLPSNGGCLVSHYLVTAVALLLISWSLPGNGCTCHNMYFENVQDLQMLFAAVTHLSDGAKSWDILMSEVEKSLICLVGTRRPTVSIIEQRLILFLRTLMRIKASRYCSLE